MPLTEQNLLTLAKPFALHEHGFVQGNPYLLKSAIRERLSKVDLLWTASEPEFVTMAGEDVVVYRGSITIGGVTRWGLGSGIIQRTDKKGNPVEGFSLAKNIAKAHKQAASDVLPRAAIEFNVGAYLKDKKPRDLPQERFAQWLAQFSGDKSTLQTEQTPGAEPKAWATAETVKYLLDRCTQGLKLTWADVARFTSIAELEDYTAWNTRYPSVTAAATFIKAAMEKEQDEQKAATSRFTQPVAAPN